jgi:hypothetical protein
MERSKKGVLTVKQAANDPELLQDLEDAFADVLATFPTPGPGQGRLL